MYVEQLGDLQQETELLQLKANDHLGKALMEMKEKLLSYQREERKRNWSAEGLAQMADILRNHSSDLEAFGRQVISYLVKYVGCNQGSLFIEDQNEERGVYLEMVACYAYDRQKHRGKNHQ